MRCGFLDGFNTFILDFNSKFSFLKLLALYTLILFEKSGFNIGHLWSKSSWKSVFASFVGNRFNINHLGNVYSIKNSSLSITQKIEKQVIQWNKKVIHCGNRNIEGYVTSGGTESNLFLMWMGREYLKEKNNSRPILLATDFTHYSINKSARILDIDSFIVKVDKKNWGMSLLDLEKVVLKFIKNKKCSFLLPITIGYSSTGASDPLKKIVELIKKLKKKHSNLKCFIWVDAAAQGLPKSFLESNFRPMESDLIKGYVVDFHKHGDTPLPSGIVLYKNNLRKLIEVPIPYLFENDSTILGSRPGSSALSIWANIVGNNRSRWKKKFSNLEIKKTSLIKRLRKINPDANILCFKNSLTFAIELNSDFKEFPKEFGSEYQFVKCEINGFIHYKFHVQ